MLIVVNIGKTNQLKLKKWGKVGRNMLSFYCLRHWMPPPMIPPPNDLRQRSPLTPKKPTHAVAHSMILSGTRGANSQMSFSLWRTSIVMGSRFFAGGSDRTSTLLIPVSTYSRRSHPLANEFPSDFCIWRHHITAKYVFIVLCLRPSPTRNATYRQSIFHQWVWVSHLVFYAECCISSLG